MLPRHGLCLGVLVGLLLLGTSWMTPGSLGASNSSQLTGDQYYSITGDWGFSTRYSNGIVLSPGSGTGSAAWAFSVSPTSPCTYEIRLGVYYTESGLFGDGPTLWAYNWGTSSWDIIVTDAGWGTNAYAADTGSS